MELNKRSIKKVEKNAIRSTQGIDFAYNEVNTSNSARIKNHCSFMKRLCIFASHNRKCANEETNKYFNQRRHIPGVPEYSDWIIAGIS